MKDKILDLVDTANQFIRQVSRERIFGRISSSLLKSFGEILLPLLNSGYVRYSF